MKRLSVTLFAGALVGLMATLPAFAIDVNETPKWSQFPDIEYGIGYNSSDHNQTKSADDWLCLDGLPINGVRWWGSYAGNTKVTPAGFTFRVYSDIPEDQPTVPFSRPGTLLFETYITNFTEQFYYTRPAIGPYGDDDIYVYTADLVPTFNQTINTIYWLEIQADTDGSAVWQWWDSDQHWNDDAVQSDPAAYGDSAWNELNNTVRPYGTTDLAFELYVVPEPGSMLIMCCGLASFAGIIRKSTKV